MIKIKIIGDHGKEKFILINPDCVVSVEKFGLNNYNVYLCDGRVHHMNQEMYEENFVEYEEEDTDDNVKIGMTS